MTEINRNVNPWTSVQFRSLLNTEHIRQHLIKVGLINRYGEVVPKEEHEHPHKRRSRRRRRASSKPVDDKPTFIQRPSTAINIRYPIETTKNSKKHCRVSKSPTYHSIDRRCKTTSISQSRQANRSSSPPRLSSLHQSTRAKSISVQRAVSPKITPIKNRSVVTMIYYGPQTALDYDRTQFEPVGDEIIVMQQHCGGENLVVYKGALRSNETFQFESRRHPNYPFALAFYVNGLIDNRLSICCESRYKHNVRIGGKRGLFGIMNVQRSQACRRCRVEQRIKRLAELKASRRLPTVYSISTPEPNITRSTTPELSMSPKEQPESPTFDEELRKNDLLKAYSSDVNEPKANIHSSLSNADEHQLSTSKNQPHSQRSASAMATEREKSDQTKAMIIQSNTDSKRTSTEINRKENFDQ